MAIIRTKNPDTIQSTDGNLSVTTTMVGDATLFSTDGRGSISNLTVDELKSLSQLIVEFLAEVANGART